MELPAQMKCLPRLALAVLAGHMVLSAFACDTVPETRPMDQPLDTGAAIEADERMQKDTEALLEEQARE